MESTNDCGSTLLIFVELIALSNEHQNQPEGLLSSIRESANNLKTILGKSCKAFKQTQVTSQYTGLDMRISLSNTLNNTELINDAIRLTAEIMTVQGHNIGLRTCICGIEKSELISFDKETALYIPSLSKAQAIIETLDIGQVAIDISSYDHLDNIYLDDDSSTSAQNLSYEVGRKLYRTYDRFNQPLDFLVLKGKYKKQNFGSLNQPRSFWHLNISPPKLTPTTKGIIKLPPEELFLKHSKIALVGATHNNLSKTLTTIKKKQANANWEKIEIFFLSDKFIANSKSYKNLFNKSSKTALQEKKESIKSLLKLKEQFDLNIYIYEYDFPLYFASYWDYDRPGGRIHISPQVYGQDTKTCPGVDYLWFGEKASKDFQHYVSGLNELRQLAHKM